MNIYTVQVIVRAASARDAWVVASPDPGLDLTHAGVEEYEVLRVEVLDQEGGQ